MLDASGAAAIARHLRGPACVIVKHTNPCGAAERGTLLEAWEAALAGASVANDDDETSFQIKAQPPAVTAQVAIKKLGFVTARKAVCVKPSPQRQQPASSQRMVSNGSAGAISPGERGCMEPITLEPAAKLGRK